MSLQVIDPMAKDRQKTDKSAPKAKPANRKAMVVQVRGSEEYKAWFEEVADLDKTTLADLVDRAVRAYAKGLGMKREQPKR